MINRARFVQPRATYDAFGRVLNMCGLEEGVEEDEHVIDADAKHHCSK